MTEETTANTPILACDLTAMRASEIVVTTHNVDALAARLYDYIPATALVLNEAEDPLVAELDRRIAGDEPGPVTAELKTLPAIPDIELTDFQRWCQTIAAGLESEQRSGAWWRAVADACVDEEFRRLLNDSAAESVQ